jgi:hypothetical protein
VLAGIGIRWSCPDPMPYTISAWFSPSSITHIDFATNRLESLSCIPGALVTSIQLIEVASSLKVQWWTLSINHFIREENWLDEQNQMLMNLEEFLLTWYNVHSFLGSSSCYILQLFVCMVDNILFFFHFVFDAVCILLFLSNSWRQSLIEMTLQGANDIERVGGSEELEQF